MISIDLQMRQSEMPLKKVILETHLLLSQQLMSSIHHSTTVGTAGPGLTHIILLPVPESVMMYLLLELDGSRPSSVQATPSYEPMEEYHGAKGHSSSYI